MNNILKTFDASFFKKITSPKSSQDLNKFLEKLPKNTSQTLLIVAGIAWAAAGALGLYTTVQLQSFTEMRAELQEMEAVKPSVPTVENRSVSRQDVEKFVENSKETYKNLRMEARGSNIQINADNTIYFGQFREAIGHIQNGGDGWRVTIEKLCVGRECGKKPLEALLKINKIEVKEPA
jgi:hypothetical protein